MNGQAKTSVDLQDTKRIHNAWKSRINKLIQGPVPWKKVNRQGTCETRLGESLETLLSQKSGQRLFRDFLKSEHCEENLDFWLACQEFKTLDNSEELIRRAARLYEEYIREDSPNQVNLDFNTRDIINRSLHHPSPLCFAVAQRKIYSLMENSSFPRFIHSEQHKLLVYAATKSRGLERHRMAVKIKSSGELIQHDSKSIIWQSNLYLCTRTGIMQTDSVNCCTDSA